LAGASVGVVWWVPEPSALGCVFCTSLRLFVFASSGMARLAPPIAGGSPPPINGNRSRHSCPYPAKPRKSESIPLAVSANGITARDRIDPSNTADSSVRCATFAPFCCRELRGVLGLVRPISIRPDRFVDHFITERPWVAPSSPAVAHDLVPTRLCEVARERSFSWLAMRSSPTWSTRTRSPSADPPRSSHPSLRPRRTAPVNPLPGEHRTGRQQTHWPAASCTSEIPIGLHSPATTRLPATESLPPRPAPGPGTPPLRIPKARLQFEQQAGSSLQEGPC